MRLSDREVHAAIEAAKEKRAARAQRRAAAAPITLPTIARINAADRNQICRWWDQFSGTDQKFSKSEKKIINRLAERYVEFGGYPKGYKKPPPIKKKGARRRNTPKAAELPAMFEALKKKHPRLSKPRIAEAIFDQHGAVYGKSAEAIERAERKWRKKNRKV